MKIKFLLFTFVIAGFFALNSNAQTPVVFAKGTSSKTLTVTVGPKTMKTFSLNVREGQVINATVKGDIGLSKTNDFPVIYLNLANAVEDVDKTQDGEGYLSVLTGRTGKYVITVGNSDIKRARTFTLKIAVTDDKADFLGGEEVEN